LQPLPGWAEPLRGGVARNSVRNPASDAPLRDASLTEDDAA
jgi:hypothetical protein